MRVRVLYFARLRECRGQAEEWVETSAQNLQGLYSELAQRHGLPVSSAGLQVAQNGEFVAWDQVLLDGADVAMMPPFSGG
jgi:sulfur-carrier protein